MTPPKTHADRVAPLAAAFASSDLIRLAVTDGDFSLEMVRRTVPVAQQAPLVLEPTPETAKAARQLIRAELVGIVRFGEPRPVVGAKIERERDIFSIEALGVRTPVSSGGKGTIVELLVIDGTSVEYGQPLVVIERV